MYEKLPVPTVNESPIPPMTSISPGLSSCTLVGRVEDLEPLVLQKNGLDFSNLFCVLWKTIILLINRQIIQLAVRVGSGILFIHYVPTCNFRDLSMLYCELNIFCKKFRAGYSILCCNCTIFFGTPVRLSSGMVYVHFGKRKFNCQVHVTVVHHNKIDVLRTATMSAIQVTNKILQC